MDYAYVSRARICIGYSYLTPCSALGFDMLAINNVWNFVV